MEERNPSQTAPYGHACMPCFKSKCKCVRRPGAEVCERCHRLRKDCVPAGSRRRRRAQQLDSAEKIIELESKLDRLVGLLETAAQSPDVSVSLRQALDNEEGIAHSKRPGNSEQKQDLPRTDPATVLSSSSSTVFTGPGSTSASTPVTSTSGHDLLCEARRYPRFSCSCATRPRTCDSLPQDADICLQAFRTRFLPFFPFIHFAPEVDAQHLQMNRPVLMRAIMAVATPSTKQKLARGEELKRILIQATILENQSSIDLLLGLLVFIAWSNDQFLNKVDGQKIGSLTRPMVLAMSIVLELHWNKPVAHTNHKVTALPIQSALPASDERHDGIQEDLEIQRAVLGCFMLSSFISSYFGQTEVMQFTSHMEEYLRNLDQGIECTSDKILSAHIRLQLLAQNIAQLDVQDRHNEHHNEPLRGPESFYFNQAYAQLQSLHNTLGPELLREDLLAAHFHYVELTVLETFYATANSHLATFSLKRAHFAWKSLEAAKSFFEVFFGRCSRSPASCTGIAFTFLAQFSKSLVVLFRLSTMSDSNGVEVRKRVDLLAILSRLVETMDHASIEAGEQSPEDLYAQFARLLRVFQQRLGDMLGSGVSTRPAGHPQQPTWVGSASHGDGTVLNDSFPDINMMPVVGFEDEAWFQDFFAQM